MIYYNVMLKSFLKQVGLLGLIMFSFGTFAQETELGMEYMKAGEYEKAKSIFQKLAKNKEIAKVIHKPYLQTLIKLKEFDEAEKFVKKQISRIGLWPGNQVLPGGHGFFTGPIA